MIGLTNITQFSIHNIFVRLSIAILFITAFSGCEPPELQFDIIQNPNPSKINIKYVVQGTAGYVIENDGCSGEIIMSANMPSIVLSKQINSTDYCLEWSEEDWVKIHVEGNLLYITFPPTGASSINTYKETTIYTGAPYVFLKIRRLFPAQ